MCEPSGTAARSPSVGALGTARCHRMCLQFRGGSLSALKMGSFDCDRHLFAVLAHRESFSVARPADARLQLVSQ